MVLGEWHGCPGLSKIIKSSLAATCLQLSWLPSQLKAEPQGNKKLLSIPNTSLSCSWQNTWKLRPHFEQFLSIT